MSEEMITTGQRGMVWALLKVHEYPCFTCETLMEADDCIPYLEHDQYDMKVWDWLCRLTMKEASEVIRYLEGTD